MNYRLESDSVGEKQVPVDAYYGVQTLRAFENFNITGRKSQMLSLQHVMIFWLANSMTSLSQTLSRVVPAHPQT